MGGLVAFGLIACNQSINSKNDVPELGLKKDSTVFLETDPETVMTNPVNLSDYEAYVLEINAKYQQNAELLQELKMKLNSNVNDIQLRFGQELFALSKRNLEIKTRVKNHVKQDFKSWEDFKQTIDADMAELEKSISGLAERLPQ